MPSEVALKLEEGVMTIRDMSLVLSKCCSKRKRMAFVSPFGSALSMGREKARKPELTAENSAALGSFSRDEQREVHNYLQISIDYPNYRVDRPRARRSVPWRFGQNVSNSLPGHRILLHGLPNMDAISLEASLRVRP